LEGCHVLDQKPDLVAVEMARRGATRGMIVQRLRQENLDQVSAAELADRALGVVATRKRFQGLGVALLGLVICALAGGAMLAGLVKIPVVAAMFGVMVFGVGLANVIRPV
jgi:hypothetical protein